MGSINTESCVGKRGDWTALYELPLFEIVCEVDEYDETALYLASDSLSKPRIVIADY